MELKRQHGIHGSNINNMKMRNNMNKYIYWAGLILLVISLSSAKAFAQNSKDKDSPTSIEVANKRALWMNSNNPAGIYLDRLNNYNSLDFLYNMTNGNYKIREEGESETLLGFRTEGVVNLNKFVAWGSFKYDNSTVKRSLYNTSMPMRDRFMPYYVADPRESEWKNQEYALHMKVATAPIWNKVHFGVDAKYRVNTSAKQIDPRSTVYLYNINLKPGVVLDLNSHKLGLNLTYDNLRQRVSYSNSDNQANQDVYVLRGLGNSSTAVIGGLQSLGTFLYTGNSVGASVQYGYKRDCFSILFDAGYNYRVEDVITSPTKPKKVGSIRENSYFGSLSIIRDANYLQSVKFSFLKRDSDGIEYVQKIDNTFENQKWVDIYSSVRSNFVYDKISFTYDLYKKDQGRDYLWKSGLLVSYNKEDDIFYLPKSTQMIENLYFGVNGGVNFLLDKNRFNLALKFIYKENLDGDYKYNGAEPTSALITDFMMYDHEILTRSYYNPGLALTYFIDSKSISKGGYYFKLSTDYIKPTEGSGDRLFTSLGFGLTF